MEGNSKFKSAMVYGLYLGLALVFMNIIQYVLDVYNPPFWVGLITYAVVIAGIVFG